MSMVRRAASNTAMLLAGQLVTWACTLVLAAAYARFLGATGFGELYLATTFTALIGFPIEYSFNQQIVRDVSRAPQDTHRYLTMGLVLKAGLWTLLYAFALALSIVLGYSGEERWLIAVCGLILISTAVSSTLISIQTAHLRVGPAKFGPVIEKVIDVVLAVLLLRRGADVQVVALVLLFGSIVGMLWQVMRVARMFGVHLAWDTRVARALVRSGMSFLAYGVLGVIYYRVDVVLLSVLGTAAAVGVYGAAYRLFDTLTFVPGIIMGGVMAPILARYSAHYSAHNWRKLRYAVEKSTAIMLLCSVPAAVGLVVAAPKIVWFIYNRSAFASSAIVLQALGVGVVALYLNAVLTTVLISTGQERKLPLMAAAALIFNVVANLILIPRAQEIGSAWATTLTEVLLLGCGLLLVDRDLVPMRTLQVGAKALAASLVMALAVHALAAYSIVLIIPIAVVVYVASAVVLRAVPREDLELLRGAVSRRLTLRLPTSPRIAALAHLRVALARRLALRPGARHVAGRVLKWVAHMPAVGHPRESASSSRYVGEGPGVEVRFQGQPPRPVPHEASPRSTLLEE